MCMGNAPEPPPPPPAPPPPPPVLEQTAPEKAKAPSTAETMNRTADGTKKYRSGLGIAGGGQGEAGGLGIAT